MYFIMCFVRYCWVRSLFLYFVVSSCIELSTSLFLSSAFVICLLVGSFVCGLFRVGLLL